MKHRKRNKWQRRSESKSRASDTWARIEPHLEEIRQLRAEGAMISKLAERYGVSYKRFSDLRKKKPELNAALDWSNKASEDRLTGKLYDLAMGRAVRVEKTEYKDAHGRLKGSSEKTIRIEPQLSANAFLLKQFHGWSNNPKVDDAVANALNKKDWTAKISLIPGFSDLSPKSSDADNFKVCPKDIGNRADAPAGQGENYNSDSLADQKEDKGDDSGE